jgi:hypothetical protein
MVEVERISAMLRAFSGDIRLRISDLQDLFVRHRLRNLAGRFRTTRKAVVEEEEGEKESDEATTATAKMESETGLSKEAPAPGDAMPKQQAGGAFLLDLMGR